MLSKSKIIQKGYKLEIICKNANGECFLRNMCKMSTLNYTERHKRSANGKILEQSIGLTVLNRNDDDALSGLHGIASTICDACYKKMMNNKSR